VKVVAATVLSVAVAVVAVVAAVRLALPAVFELLYALLWKVRLKTLVRSFFYFNKNSWVQAYYNVGPLLSSDGGGQWRTVEDEAPPISILSTMYTQPFGKFADGCNPCMTS